MATAMDRWVYDFPFHLPITRTQQYDEYYDFSEVLKKNNIKFILMGGSVGFMTEEDLFLAKLLR